MAPIHASFSTRFTYHWPDPDGKETLDYEAQQNIYNVTVEVTDGIDSQRERGPRRGHQLSVTIHVTDVNESPQAVNATRPGR